MLLLRIQLNVVHSSAPPCCLRRNKIVEFMIAVTLKNCKCWIYLVSDRSDQSEATEFVDFGLFLAAVSKHKNIVKMLYCQTRRTPMYLVLEASFPGNLLHFLWSLREVKTPTLTKNIHGLSHIPHFFSQLNSL